jgi:murein DD-endopeptidase MepM/ murein hydrolase activator NlpD
MADKKTSKKKKKKKRSLIPWISKNHRMVVVNDQTFVEEKSWRLSPVNVGFFSGGVVLSVMVLTMLLLKFTPLGYLVMGSAGVADSGLRKEMDNLFKQLDTLNTEIANNTTYMENIKRLTTEEFEYEEDMEKPKSATLTETGAAVDFEEIPEKSDAVEQLEESVKMERELGSLVQSIFLEDEDRIDRNIFVSPLTGVVSDTFAPKRSHYGTDVVAPKGSVIQSVRAGTVIMSTWSADTGHMIGVQHDNNLISWYKHNSARLKKLGDRVEAGEAIAIIGNTGEMTDGPHLHFELWYNGQPVNPQKYIDF